MKTKAELLAENAKRRDQLLADIAARHDHVEQDRIDQTMREPPPIIHKTYTPPEQPQPSNDDAWNSWCDTRIDAALKAFANEVDATNADADDILQALTDWIERLAERVSALETRLQIVEGMQSGEIVPLPKAKTDAAVG
jgi:hypothetical protein